MDVHDLRPLAQQAQYQACGGRQVEPSRGVPPHMEGFRPPGIPPAVRKAALGPPAAHPVAAPGEAAGKAANHGLHPSGLGAVDIGVE